MKQKLNTLTIALTLATLLNIYGVGCTKQRAPQFPDGQGDDIIEKALFESTEVKLKLAEQAEQVGDEQRLKSVNEVDKFKVIDIDSPKELRSLFLNLTVRAHASSTQTIHFITDKRYVTALRMINDSDTLSTQDHHLSMELNGRRVVPLFKYAIKACGTLVRSKNDLGEDTHVLRLKETECKDATHIQISTLSSDRLNIEPSPTDRDEIFVTNRINAQVFKSNELQRLNLRANLAQDGLFFAQVDLETLRLYEITTKSLLTDTQLKRLKDNPGTVLGCDEALRQKLARLSDTDCVMIRKINVAVSPSSVRLQPEDNGISSPTLEFRDISASDTNLVRIPKNPVIRFAELDGPSSPDLDLEVEKVKNTEFLLRRTIEDSPNSFEYTFPGASGNLEIIKFIFTKDRVQVVRSEPLVSSTGSNSTDIETLMSMPARYFRKLTRDASGNPLANPQFITTDFDDPQAIAEIQWDANSMPNISSPLDYYSLEQCFDGTTDRRLMGMDRRIEEGMLSFTLEHKYQASRSNDCVGVLQAGYFDTTQSNFTFRERVSFKRHDKSHDAQLLDIPYSAQKKLGFGLFTYKKIVPTAAGNTGTIGTEVPLPAIFDLKGGRQITYILAGLPQESKDTKLRNAIIQATREVVADLNKAFKTALSGTTLDRVSDVVVLKIAGEDMPEDAAGTLGDLDRNYIYFVQKKTESGVIGLGGAHANPKSGVVEAASVFIYGGNITSYIESLKKVDQVRKEYDDIMSSAKLSSSTSSPGNIAAPVSVPASIPETVLMPASQGTKPGLLAVSARNTMNSAIHRLDMGNQRIAQLVGRLGPEQLAFHNAIQAALKDGGLTNTAKIERLILENRIRTSAGSIRPQELAKMKAELNRKNSIASLLGKMEKAGICLFQTKDLPARNTDTSSYSDLELMVSVFKPTLAHELGHNMGLRHNFMGSFDKANWKSTEDEASSRDYSSIMDYLANDHETYDGFGPQDIASLRAAYAQLVELDPSLLTSVTESGLITEVEGKKMVPTLDGRTQIELINGRFVRLSDYISAIGTNWYNLTSSAMSILPLKKFDFCSDEDTRMSPVCNPFDSGTTPEEIVNSIADNYRSMYALRNFPGNRLRFDDSTTDGYIGRLFSLLIPARQFLEETFYQAITGGGSEAVNSNLDGAISALLMLHTIARTPDAPVVADGRERFAKTTIYKSDTETETIVVERKWLENQRADQDSEKLSIRGIEYDKVIAMILLTERKLGFPKYEQASLRVSFPQLEKLVKLSLDRKSPDGLITLNLIKGNLTENLRPAVATPGGGFTFIGSERFKSSTTDLIRTYSIIGGMLNLDIDSLEVSDNFSMLFRVRNGFSAPSDKDVTSILPSGVEPDNSRGELSYWAFNHDVSASSIVKQAKLLDSLISKKEKLQENVTEWAIRQVAMLGAATPEEKEKLNKEILALAEAIDLELADLPDGVGSKKITGLTPSVMMVINKAIQLAKFKSLFNPREFALILDNTRTQFEFVANNIPTFGLILELLPVEKLRLPVLEDIIPGRSQSSLRAILFRNAQTLSDIFLTVHPEYRSN